MPFAEISGASREYKVMRRCDAADLPLIWHSETFHLGEEKFMHSIFGWERKKKKRKKPKLPKHINKLVLFTVVQRLGEALRTGKRSWWSCADLRKLHRQKVCKAWSILFERERKRQRMRFVVRKFITFLLFPSSAVHSLFERFQQFRLDLWRRIKLYETAFPTLQRNAFLSQPQSLQNPALGKRVGRWLGINHALCGRTHASDW